MLPWLPRRKPAGWGVRRGPGGSLWMRAMGGHGNGLRTIAFFPTSTHQCPSTSASSVASAALPPHSAEGHSSTVPLIPVEHDDPRRLEGAERLGTDVPVGEKTFAPVLATVLGCQ
jgi:hypothetical protein